MGFDLSVFLSAGIQDALCPMQLAMVAVCAAMMLCLRQSKQWVLLISAIMFLLTLVFGAVVFDLKLFDALMSPDFLSKVKWVFLMLGAGSLMVGVLFLREWYFVISGTSRRFAEFFPTPYLGPLAGTLLAIILAGSLVFFASVWPINYQVLIQAEMAAMPGRLRYSLIALLVYECCRNVGPLLIVVSFFLARQGKSADFLRGKLSLLSIMASAFYIAVGGCLIFFFYVAAQQSWL
jgi:hypothetical protein